MNFDFSDDDKMIRDQVNRFLRDKCGFDEFRSVLEGDAAYSENVWRGLSEMGVRRPVAARRCPPRAAYRLCLAARELGAHLAPVPFSSSIYLAAEAIQRTGSETQKEEWLPKLVSGEIIGTLAVTETVRELAPEDITTTFAKGKLNGTKLVVPHGVMADVAVVLARTNDGLSLVLVSLSEVERRSIETVDPTMGSATIMFKDSPAELLGESHDGWAALSSVYNRAAVLFAFEQLGGAERALDMAVGYAKERFAFGRPIGSFQGLKHMMADMYVALKLAESNCYYAAWALGKHARPC